MTDTTTMPIGEFYLVESGAPCDAIWCGPCLRARPDAAALTATALTVEDMKQIVADDGAGGCEICGIDFPRAELADRAWEHWIREAGEAAAGRRITSPEFHKLNAAVAFRDHNRAVAGRAIVDGNPAEAARATTETVRWARRMFEALSLWHGSSDAIAAMRKEGLC